MVFNWIVLFAAGVGESWNTIARAGAKLLLSVPEAG